MDDVEDEDDEDDDHDMEDDGDDEDDPSRLAKHIFLCFINRFYNLLK